MSHFIYESQSQSSFFKTPKRKGVRARERDRGRERKKILPSWEDYPLREAILRRSSLSLFVRVLCAQLAFVFFLWMRKLIFWCNGKVSSFFSFYPYFCLYLPLTNARQSSMVKKDDDKKFSLFFGVKHFSPSSETQIFSRVRRDKRAISRARFVSIVQPFG